MIPQKEQQRLFETIQLPTLIKNEKVPTLTSETPDGGNRILFKRNSDSFEMHKYVYDILEKHNLLDDILHYFKTETAIKSILLSDDEGIKFKLELN